MAEEKKIIRRNRPSELEKVIRELGKLAPVALARLAKLVESTDEKIALDASKAIPKMLADFKHQAEEADLKMILVQHKLGTLPKPGDLEDDTPTINFDELQSVE